MNGEATMRVKAADRRVLADGVVGLTVAPVDPAAAPPWRPGPGAHV